MQYMFDICALVIAVGIIFSCARKGLFLTVLSFFKFLLAVLAAYFFGSKLGALLGKLFINEAVYGSVSKKITKIYETATGTFNADSITEAIPRFLRSDALTEKLNGLSGSGEELAESMSRTVSDALSAVICTVVGAILMFVIAMVALTIVYAILKAIRSKFRLLGLADGILGALLGCMIAALALMLFSSAVKLFFGTTDAYNASKLVRFFGDATLNDIFGWLNIDRWIDKING